MNAQSMAEPKEVPAGNGTGLALAQRMTSTPRLVRDLMTTKVVTLGRNESLTTVDDVMRLGRIRHLPVVDDDGTLAGIVSQRDLFHSGLLRALGYGTHSRARALETMVVKEAMKSEVVTITPDTPLATAAQLMIERQIGCLVVLDGQTIVGILTEGDFVRTALS